MLCNKCKQETETIKMGKRKYVGGIYQMKQCIKCGHTQKCELIKELVI